MWIFKQNLKGKIYFEHDIWPFHKDHVFYRLSFQILKEGCYYVNGEPWAHDPKRFYTYVIGVDIIEIFHDYSITM